MKRIYPLSLGLVLMLSLLSGAVHADTTPAPRATPTSKAKKKLLTDVSFSGSSVDGRYHSAGDAVAEVDKEKQLNSLIGMRKNFHDRLGAERARLAKVNGAADSKGATP
jgi:hypothetical protein